MLMPSQLDMRHHAIRLHFRRLPPADVAIAHLVVHILDQPEGHSLHWVALLLKLSQQVYVGCTCGMQRAAFE